MAKNNRLKPEQLQIISSLLTEQKATWPTLPAKMQLDLAVKGALLSLAQDASPEAVHTLEQAAAAYQGKPLGKLVITLLDDLAQQGVSEARNALANLVIRHSLPDAVPLVVSHHYTPDSNSDTALLYLLTDQGEKYLQADPAQNLLTRIYFEASEELQSRVLRAARRIGLEDWAVTVAAVQEGTDESLLLLSAAIPRFKTAQSRQLALMLLRDLADRGSPSAQEAIVQLFLETDDPTSHDIAVERGYAPKDHIQRALFYLLSGQREKYETFDFNHSLLSVAYETASKATRQRIIAQTRKMGHLEWAQALTGARRVRWVNDMSDADWELALFVLSQSKKYHDLWRLAQIAPPVWSAQALQALHSAGWMPVLEEQPGFEQLIRLAGDCNGSLPGIPEGNLLNGHMADVTCLAVSRARGLVASGSGDGSVRVYSLERGRLMNSWPMPKGQARSIAFSPDGDILAVGSSDNNIHLFRVNEGELIKIFTGHTGLIKSVEITPDGRLLASASFDGTVRLWRFPYGPETRLLVGHHAEVFCLATSPDGLILASGGADKDVRLWRLPDGTLMDRLPGHLDTVTSLAISPDGLFMASGGRDHTIRLWSLPDGYPLKTFERQSHLVTGLAIHPFGQIVAGGSFNGTVTLWSASTGKPLKEIQAHNGPVTGLVLSPDGSTLISGGTDRKIRLFDLRMFLTTRLPLEKVRVDDLFKLRASLDEVKLSPSDRNWLEFATAQAQWHQRFDIAVEEPQRIEVGEFDIEIL